MTTAATPELVRPPVVPPANAPVPPPGATLIADAMCAPFDVQQAKDRLDLLMQFFADVMEEGIEKDYGPPFPGSKAKQLYTSGADKCCQFLGVYPRPRNIERIEEWGRGQGEKAFFHFEDEVDLVSLRTGQVVAIGVGSCNTLESKYRWRKLERVCPECGVAAIKKSKYPDRETGDIGFYCNKNMQGCGENFRSDDEDIIDQEIGVVENDDVAGMHHTIRRMSVKRAKVHAVTQIISAIGLLIEPGEDKPGATGQRRGGASPNSKATSAAKSTEPMCTQDERRQLIETAANAGHTTEEMQAWWKQHHDLDTTRQNIPKALFAAALERFGKSEKLVEAVD